MENDVAITSSLADAIGACPDIDTEKAVKITVQPQAYFKVQAVTRLVNVYTLRLNLNGALRSRRSIIIN